MTRSILSIGECMVELSPRPDGSYRQGFAGDTFNTAWYLRRNLPPDWIVGYFTSLGQDPLSDGMAAFMADAGIDTRHVARIPGRTPGLYLISLKQGERSFSYWRGESAARHLADDPEALTRACTGADLLYLSGITLAILAEPARETLLAALAKARADGSRIAFDPNLRPRLWDDSDTLRRWITRAAAGSDIVLPSFDDEAGQFGDADPKATAKRYRDAGAALVIVKNGAGPVLWQDKTAAGSVTPDRVALVVDTTAAGDSFNAGFLAAHLQGMDLATACAAGATLAGKVITARGALVPV